MKTYNEPKIKEEVVCDLCKTIIREIELKDLDWRNARMNLGEPSIICPVCRNEIYDVLKGE